MGLFQKKILRKDSILLLIAYVTVFVYCITTDAIYSFDTYSYLKAMPFRQLGYVIFLKSFNFIFGGYFELAVVFVHTVFSLFAVHYFYKKTASLFKLNLFLKLPLLLILLFPFFPPLLIANNLCSEGLGYGLYLVFIAVGMEILFNNKKKYIKYYAIVFLALVFIRSQFIISTLIFAGVYFLSYRKHIAKQKHILNLVVFCSVILVASLTERTYHKLKDGFFKPTPLGYTSASTAPIYISNKSDYKLIEDEDYRNIFQMSYDTLVKKDLLPKSTQTPKEKYLFFHENLPKICNQTVRSIGIDYYFSKDIPKGFTEQQAISYPIFETEAACKVFTFVLIKANFKKWIQLYYLNITFGFYSPILFFFVIFIFLFSLFKTVFFYQKPYAVLFLLSSLILSNALFIAFASHSIMRYLFYNYALFFLLLICTFNLLRRDQQA